MVSAEHQLGVGAVSRHVLDMPAHIRCALNDLGVRRIVHRVVGDALVGLAAQGRDERLPIWPVPGGSMRPRAKTTSTCGQDPRPPQEGPPEPAGWPLWLKSQQTPLCTSASEASAHANGCPEVGPHKIVWQSLQQTGDEAGGLADQVRFLVAGVREGIAALRADGVAVGAQVDRLPANGIMAADTGLPNLVAGLPNTATAATLSARLWGSGGAEPTSPTLLPRGVCPSACRPPRPLRIAAEDEARPGQVCAIAVMRWVASLAPSAAARKSQLAG